MKSQQKIRVGLWFSVIMVLSGLLAGQLAAAPSELQMTRRIVQTYGGNDLTGGDWSPDGRWFALPTHDGNIELWDTAAANLTRIIHAHQGNARWVKFSPDGKWFVSVGDDCNLVRWELASGRMLSRMRLAHQPLAVNLNSSGTLFAICSKDKTLDIGSLESNSTIYSKEITLSGNAKYNYILYVPHFSQDSNRVGVSSSQFMRFNDGFPAYNYYWVDYPKMLIIDWKDNNITSFDGTLGPCVFGASNDEFFYGYNYIGYNEDAYLISIYRENGFSNGQPWKPHFRFSDLVYLPKTRQLVGSAATRLSDQSWHAGIYIFNLPDTTPCKSLALPGGTIPTRISATADGTQILAAGNGHLYAWAADTGALLYDFAVSSKLADANQIEYAPNGQLFGRRISSLNVAVLDVKSGKTVQQWDAANSAALSGLGYSLFKFSHNSSQIALASIDGIIEIADIATGKIIKSLKLKLDQFESLHDIGFSPDGIRFLMLCDDHLWVYDFKQHKLKAYSQGGFEMQIVDPVRLIIRETGEGNLIEYEWPLDRTVRKYEAHADWMNASKDGSRVVYSRNNSFYLLDWKHQRKIAEEGYYLDAWRAKGLKLMPDGKSILLLLSYYSEERYRDYVGLCQEDLMTGEPISYFFSDDPDVWGNHHVPSAVAVAPNGRRVLVATDNMIYAYEPWQYSNAGDWPLYE
jgi:WD40 repeat protein